MKVIPVVSASCAINLISIFFNSSIVLLNSLHSFLFSLQMFVFLAHF